MINIDWESKTRVELLLHLIQKNSYSSYLEIGCDKNQVFNKIHLENKIFFDN